MLSLSESPEETMKLEITKHSHSVGESNFHYQLTAAYRQPIFADERVQKLVKAYLYAKAEDLHIVIVTANFGPDHMHFFAAGCKNHSAAKLIGQIKGYIAHQMRKHHRKFFGHLLWGEKFWTSGYFYRSIGQANSEAIRYYIEHSQEKHWEVVDYEVYQQNQATLMQF